MGRPCLSLFTHTHFYKSKFSTNTVDIIRLLFHFDNINYIFIYIPPFLLIYTCIHTPFRLSLSLYIYIYSQTLIRYRERHLSIVEMASRKILSLFSKSLASQSVKGMCNVCWIVFCSMVFGLVFNVFLG